MAAVTSYENALYDFCVINNNLCQNVSLVFIFGNFFIVNVKPRFKENHNSAVMRRTMARYDFASPFFLPSSIFHELKLILTLCFKYLPLFSAGCCDLFSVVNHININILSPKIVSVGKPIK